MPPAPESGVPNTQTDSTQSSTSRTPATSQQQEPTQTPEVNSPTQSKTPESGQTTDTTPATPGTKPANPAPKPTIPGTKAGAPAVKPKQHHAETPNTVGPQDGTCNHPGEHQWNGNDKSDGTGNPVTLNWNEHTDGSDCMLELESGTEPDFGKIDDSPIPWRDASVTKLTARHHAGTPEDPKVQLLDGWGTFDGVYLPNLVTVDVGELDVSRCKNFGVLFGNHSKLTSITGLENWDTSNATSMRWLFANESQLTTVTGINSWDTSHVTDMTYMFYKDTNLTTFDLNSWDTSKVSDMTQMLPPNLKALRLGKKTRLLNATPNAAFANVTQTGNWADKSGITNPAWQGNTAQLATRAAGTNRAGAYVIDGFNFTFATPVSAIPLTGTTREQLLRNLLLLLGAGALALAVVAVTRHTRNRWASPPLKRPQTSPARFRTSTYPLRRQRLKEKRAPDRSRGHEAGSRQPQDLFSVA